MTGGITTKYHCYISNMSQTAIMSNGNTDQSVLHTCAKTKTTAISTSHVIVMYVPETNMLLKCHIYNTYAN